MYYLYKTPVSFTDLYSKHKTCLFYRDNMSLLDLYSKQCITYKTHVYSIDLVHHKDLITQIYIKRTYSQCSVSAPPLRSNHTYLHTKNLSTMFSVGAAVKMQSHISTQQRPARNVQYRRHHYDLITHIYIKRTHSQSSVSVRPLRYNHTYLHNKDLLAMFSIGATITI